MTVKVLFFGVLAEVTGTNCRHYNEAVTISALMRQIQDEFPEIVHYDFRVSVNNELIDNEPALNDGDEVAFI